MIKGVITTKDVLANSFTIFQCFGLSCLLRCCEAVLRQEQTTFLACVYPRCAPAPVRITGSRGGRERAG